MEIVPGIHQVDGVNGNAYIIDRESLVVIDTGLRGSGRKILGYIRETLHRRQEEMGTIVLTHYHMDHTGGVAALKRASGTARVAVHEADAGYVSGRTVPPRFPGARGMLLGLAEQVVGPGPVEPDLLLADGDRIGRVRCVHLPGHTPGSIGLLDEASGVFFCGDTLRYDGKAISGGPAAFVTDPVAQRESILRMAALEFDTLLVGHGVPLRPEASARVREFAEDLPPV
jgi:glyoxylase-like metal-dependent hydrolase (beta-lactamase superfamily II)